MMPLPPDLRSRIENDLALDYQVLVDTVHILARTETDPVTGDRRFSMERPDVENLVEIAAYQRLPVGALLGAFGHRDRRVDPECPLLRAVRHEFGQLESWPFIPWKGGR